jgi:hypothetical protein
MAVMTPAELIGAQLDVPKPRGLTVDLALTARREES